MPRQIVLLRGINLVKRNRIAMPELRTALDAEGFGGVQTYVQSGNIVLSSPASPERVAEQVNATIKKRFGFDIVVIVRSHAELAAVVQRNPLAKIATNPSRYLVTFLSAELPSGFGHQWARVANQEAFAVTGREVYSWHRDGVGRSPLWERLASKSLGVAATSRNWATVTTLLAMAGDTTAR
ncbi:MAG: DUF1697 domain-containing protein [Chloroflexi bacterium]|nr:MAG: DUF1697 domain-containing protein [Chloroflexota bacterium]